MLKTLKTNKQTTKVTAFQFQQSECWRRRCRREAVHWLSAVRFMSRSSSFPFGKKKKQKKTEKPSLPSCLHDLLAKGSPLVRHQCLIALCKNRKSQDLLSKCSVSLNLVEVQLAAELQDVPLRAAVTLPEGAPAAHRPRVHATRRVAVQLLVRRVLLLLLFFVALRLVPRLQPRLLHAGKIGVWLAGVAQIGRGEAWLAAVGGGEPGTAQALKGLKVLNGEEGEKKSCWIFTTTSNWNDALFLIYGERRQRRWRKRNNKGPKNM